MPAAAVIPALIVYIYFVAFKMFVFDFLRSLFWRSVILGTDCEKCKVSIASVPSHRAKIRVVEAEQR